MSAVLKLDSVLESLECANCCMTFGVPSRFVNDRRSDHKIFFCPSGHPSFYGGQSEVEKLRSQLTAKEAQLEWAEKARANAERSLSATKGVLTRTKNRIGKGICPCCKRSFASLQKHMASQHPNYTDQD